MAQKTDVALKDWDLRFPWVQEKLAMLRREGVSVVFDIGAGETPMQAEAERHGLTYRAYDMVTADGVKVWNIEESFPYEERPEAVIFMEVIEHLRNPWLGMQNLSNLLPVGGWLLLSTPNPAWSDSRLNTFRRGFPTMFSENDLLENHHVFTPWKHILKRLLEDSGFEIVSFETIGRKTRLNEKPFWSPALPLRLLYRAIKLAIESSDPDAIGSTYGVVARKVSNRPQPAPGPRPPK